MFIAICDDDQQAMRSLQSALEQALKIIGMTARITCFQDGKELLVYGRANNIQFSLVFLDIYMTGMTGVETAKQLRALSERTEIVFVTTSREYAVEAFSLRALHYLVKPVTVEQLMETLGRLTSQRVSRRMIALKIGRDVVQVYLDTILYIQSENKSTAVYLAAQSEPLRTAHSLREMEEMLGGGPFLKIQRGFLVNMHFVDRMTSDSCRLKNGQTLLLSRKERAEIRTRYKEFIFSQLPLNQPDGRNRGL
ncbi:LytR/AlgR family response regulator transcription factor [Candidatus Soleaferrea massiliensis]|uniref:LytR/AlgR family response regulator transcription factor n=1 Tax=Candidatus Soleaferrea massiliensis TaxID=1470354 RepID=UPI00058FF7CE|nr:LytTR family DNA-binding domain-containing protein [Candidatus Soleaferrea massiliensis]